MNSRRQIIFHLLVQVTFASSLSAAEYYVSPSGSDGAAGGSAAPWRTLQRAADAVRAGDTVVARAGSYAGFDLTTSGTAAAPITFRSESPGAAVIASRNPRTADGVNLEGASYAVVDGFAVDNAGGTITRAGIRSVTNAHVTIRNNAVDRAGSWGILTGFSDDLLIEGNRVGRTAAQHGIYVGDSSARPVVRGNTVFANNWAGIHLNGGSDGGSGVITGALVEGNVIYGNGVGPGGSGINGDGLQNSRIQNNLVYDNYRSGISLYKDDAAAPSTNNVVVNNTVVMPTNGSGYWPLNIANGSTGNAVYNNVFYSYSTTRGAMSVSQDSLSGFYSDYNAVASKFTYSDGAATMTLAQWQAATGQDQHSRVATPSQLFVNPSAAASVDKDFHLLAGSPAKDAGTARPAPKAPPTFDLDGNPRPSGSAYDIGAYELVTGTTPPADTTPPTISGVASSNISSSGANVAWATNESADTQVDFGTTTAYGSSTTLNGAMVTSHNVQLSGLAAGTTYHFRVRSGDAAGNVSTSADYTLTTAAGTTPPPTTPTSPTTPGSWKQTTASDFSSGTATNAWVTATSDGELQLGRAFSDYFDGTALGSDWTTANWNAGGTATSAVSGGTLTLAGRQLRSSSSFAPTTVEAHLAFGAAASQHFGLATNLNTIAGNSWAIFSTGSTTNTLYARVNSNGATTDVNLGALPTGLHAYRVQPVSGGFSFYVDNVLKTTINRTFAAGTMTRVALSSYQGSPQPAMQVDWVRTPYQTKGTYTSAVFDAGGAVDWTTAMLTANIPAGTSVLIETSTGNTATPDSTWSAWSAVDSAGNITSPNGQYLRYRLTLTSNNGSATPIVSDVTFNYA